VQSREGFTGAPRCGRPRKARSTTPSRATGHKPLASTHNEPFPNGLICRALEIPPDDPDAAEHRRSAPCLLIGTMTDAITVE